MACRVAADLAGIPLSRDDIERIAGAPPCEGEGTGESSGEDGGARAVVPQASSAATKYLQRQPHRSGQPIVNSSLVPPPGTASLIHDPTEEGGGAGLPPTSLSSLASGSGGGGGNRAMFKGRGGSRVDLLSAAGGASASHLGLQAMMTEVRGEGALMGNVLEGLISPTAELGERRGAEGELIQGPSDGEGEDRGGWTRRVSKTLSAMASTSVALDFTSAQRSPLGSGGPSSSRGGNRGGGDRGVGALPLVQVDDSATGLKRVPQWHQPSGRKTSSPTPLLSTCDEPSSDVADVAEGSGAVNSLAALPRGRGQRIPMSEPWLPWLMCCCGPKPK